MNILFLTLVKIDTLETRGIYHDLMREFSSNGHHVYIVSPTERREKKSTSLKSEGNVHFLNVKTLNVQKTNIVEKGISTLSLEQLFLQGLKKFFKNVKFDVVIYSTPPITFTKVIEYIKKKDGAKSYLLLKDIFPQNAVDMGMMSKNGLIYRFFRNKEKKLYEISDTIGCMSEANKKYVLKHNPNIAPQKVEVNPNSIEPQKFPKISQEEKTAIRRKYNIPDDSLVFVYGGNLGKPQGLDFLLQTIDALKDSPHIYFAIIGSGTEYQKIEKWFETNEPKNAQLFSALPREDYYKLIRSFDVGLIFLDKNFTIPNFPSRLLSYIEMKMPVIAATDKNTDVGSVIEEAGCGFKVLSGDIEEMRRVILRLQEKQLLDKMGENAYRLLIEKYTVDNSYNLIMKRLAGND